MADESSQPETKLIKAKKVLKILACIMAGFLVGVLIGSIVLDFDLVNLEFGFSRHVGGKLDTGHYSTQSPHIPTSTAMPYAILTPNLRGT